MRKLAIALAAVIGCPGLMAMPTEQEMEAAIPVIEELTRDASAALKARKMTRVQFAETVLGFLSDADTEATKTVLVRQAFRQLMLAGATEKAVETYKLLGANVADVPNGTFGAWSAPFVATLAKADKANELAFLLEHAINSGDAESATILSKQMQPYSFRLNASKNGGARLTAVAGRLASLSRCKKEARNLRAALQRDPDNVAIHGKLGLCLAAMGDWKEALKEFAQSGGKLAEVAEWENTRPDKSPLTAADIAEFWWEKAWGVKEAEAAAALRNHAAGWYQAAVDGDELTGLKKTLAEKRIAEVAKAGEVAAEPISNEAATKKGLLHRWSFNGSLKDSVGGCDGKAIDGNVTFSKGEVRIKPGGGYVDLGADVIPGGGVAEFTIEVWATKYSVQNWARVFQIPDNWGKNDFFWAWNHGTDPRKWQWKVAGYGAWNRHQGDGTGIGVENHFVVVYGHDEEKQPYFHVCFLRGKDVYWHRSEKLTGEMFKSHSAFWLGHGATGEATADASYNEVRIWNRAFSHDEIMRSAKWGPDKLP